MNKIKTFIARCIVPNPLKRGRELWDRFYMYDSPLFCRLLGDDSMVSEFAKMAAKLPFWDFDALKQWLKFSYDELERNMPECTDAFIEYHYSKWRRIYRNHIEALGE